jgi:hypothetical protein
LSPGELLLFAASVVMLLALTWTILSAIEYMRDAFFLFRPVGKVAQKG